MRARNTIALAIVGALLAAVPSARANTVGKPASDFTLKTHDGKSLTLSKLKGKRGAVLVFFATWCPSCMAEVPQVKKLVEATRDKKVLVYGVNFRQSQRIVAKFVRDKAVNYRILLDSDGKVTKAYGVSGIPTVLGIDAAGIVRYRAHAIPKDHDAFTKLLTKPLEEK